MSEQVKVARIPNCDLTDKYGDHDEPVPAAYDGKTIFGPWAYMCEACFAKFGIGLGTGRGQRLVLEEGKNDGGSR